MRAVRFLVGLACLVTVVGLGTWYASSHRKQVVGQPCLVIVNVDGWSVADLSAGDAPVLARLASEGVIFTRQYSQSDNPSFSETSLLSSLYPSEVAPLVPSLFRIPDDLLTLPRILRMYDYATVAFTGGPAAASPSPSPSAAPSGFPDFGFEKTESEGVDSLGGGVPRALKWMASARKPFLVYLRGADLHGPGPRSEVPGRPDVKGGLPYVDAWLGVLLQRMGEVGLDESNVTLFLVSSRPRSGPGQGDAASLRVPMLAWGAAVSPSRRGARVDSQTANVDLLPTALASVGIVLPARIRGESRLADLKDADPGAPPITRMAVAEGETWATAFQDGRHQLLARGVRAGSPRLVALLEKPIAANPKHFSLVTLDDSGVAQAAPMPSPEIPPAASLRLALLQAERSSIVVRQAARSPLSPELRKTLQEHGYW